MKNPKFPSENSSILSNIHLEIMEYFEPRAPEWTCSEVLQLIKEYGNRPALWDPECEDYKNKFRKHHKWLELAAIFKCSKLEVERKMKILNSQYRRERLKALKMKKLGKTHQITWYGYKAFGFMNRQWMRFKYRNNVNNQEENRIKQEENREEITQLESSSSELNEDLREEHSVTESSDYLNPNDGFHFRDNCKEREMQDCSKDGASKVIYDNKDEWALFGEMVAHTFRKLPNDKSRCIVKHKINTILYEAEISFYENTK